jgi:hypothetical protein
MLTMTEGEAVERSEELRKQSAQTFKEMDQAMARMKAAVEAMARPFALSVKP